MLEGPLSPGPRPCQKPGRHQELRWTASWSWPESKNISYPCYWKSRKQIFSYWTLLVLRWFVYFHIVIYFLFFLMLPSTLLHTTHSSYQIYSKHTQGNRLKGYYFIICLLFDRSLINRFITLTKAELEK